MEKIAIYQLFPRYFGNSCPKRMFDGDISQNGCGKFADVNDKALNSIKELGITHLWLTGIIEHATKTDYSSYGILKDHPAIVKGKAGSPYAVKDYYDVDPDLAVDPENRMKEFCELLDRCHDNGFKVIIDFVPNHLARNYKSDIPGRKMRDFGADDYTDHAFDPSNNFYYLPCKSLKPQFDVYAGEAKPYTECPAKVTGNDCFSESPGVGDWYETVKLNYGIDYNAGGLKYFKPEPSTWFKMLDVLEYWVNKGIDGFRCDMAEMVPVEFWNWVIKRVKKVNPAVIFIAENYNTDQYEDFCNAGFDLLYDKEGMYTTLREVIEEKRPASDITYCWQSVNNIFPHMLYFLENHDEQRIASDYFAKNPFKGLPGFIVASCLYVNPVMLYYGQELGEKGMYTEGFSGKDGRSTIFDYWSMESLTAWNSKGKWNGSGLSPEQNTLRKAYSAIMNIAMSEKSITKGEFFDLTYANIEDYSFNTSRQFAFIRKYGNEFIIAVVNFAGNSTDTLLNIPAHAFTYLEIPDNCQFEAYDLLSHKKMNIYLSSGQKLRLNLPGYSGVMLKCNI